MEEENNNKPEDQKNKDQEQHTPEEQKSQSSLDTGGNLGGLNISQDPELSSMLSKIMDIRKEMAKYVIGQHEMVDLLLISILSNGHVLLEGVPGIAKTLTSKVLAKMLKTDFSRIQFTPDLMPSDVLGTSIFDMKENKFNFQKGPIFSNIVLIDEINRAPAKTQAALFEVMEERQITYDGHEYKMDFPFLVIATQNPVEQEGTYNLPEAQLDRFLFKIKLYYPSLNEEFEILNRYKNLVQSPDLNQINAILSADELKKMQSTVEKVAITDGLLKYIAEITHKTRNHARLYLGASPRASLTLVKTAKANAAIQGRNFVIPDDIQSVAMAALNHRLVLSPEAEMEGLKTEDIIDEIVKSIEVPR